MGNAGAGPPGGGAGKDLPPRRLVEASQPGAGREAPREGWTSRLIHVIETSRRVRPPRPVLSERPSGTIRILLVDDEPDIRDSLATFVAETLDGVEVLTAATGQEALELLQERSVTAIISDYRMPGMDGLSFLEQAGPRCPEARRFLLTAYPGPEVEDRAHQVGVEAVLRKPVAINVLVQLLQGLGTQKATA
ncbi:MAG TPA: response regulator [Candidatus Thermoplasmatota archaeon]|nr:response regulator [Candidatus Thermoplasmatota archaeon]